MPEAPPVGFWANIRRRIIVLSDMERDVRLTFMAGLAVVSVAVVLNLFQPIGPPVHTVIGDVPAGTLSALVVGELIVVTLISIGLIETRGRMRLALFSGVGVMAFAFLALNDFDPAAVLLLVPFGMLFVLSILRQQKTWDRKLTLTAAVATAVVTLIIVIISLPFDKQVVIISLVGWQGTVAMLGLFMAATDFAEIVSLATDSAVSQVEGVFKNRGVAIALALIAVFVNIFTSFRYTTGSSIEISRMLGSGLGLVPWLLLPYGLVKLAGRRLEHVAPEIRYASLLIVVSAYFIALQIGVASRVLSNPLTYDPRQLFTYVEVFRFPILLLLVSIVLLFLIGRRSARRFVPLAFAVWIGMLWFHYFASHGTALIEVQDTVALGSLIYLAVAARKRSMQEGFATRCRLVVELNLSFALYSLIVLFFLSSKGHGGALTIGQAVLVLGALLWEMLSSGEAITNRDTASFPRMSRVCLFLSYVVSVALLVLVSVSSELVMPGSGRHVEGIFESELLVATGLALFGPPFFLLMTSLRARELLVPRREASAVPVTAPPDRGASHPEGFVPPTSPNPPA